jgi:hypothetical protein
VLFALSWRLGPILAGVIIATAFTANMYKQQTKAVETENAMATNEMNNIANQAFESIMTVRCGCPPPPQLSNHPLKTHVRITVGRTCGRQAHVF